MKLDSILTIFVSVSFAAAAIYLGLLFHEAFERVAEIDKPIAEMIRYGLLILILLQCWPKPSKEVQ